MKKRRSFEEHYVGLESIGDSILDAAAEVRREIKALRKTLDSLEEII